MLSTHFLDAHLMNGPVQSVSPGGGSAAVQTSPASPFQAVLERLMTVPDPFDLEWLTQERQVEGSQLLTLNPYVNIKAVMAAHPEQQVFYAEGAIRIQEARAQSVLPPVPQGPPPPVVHEASVPALRDNEPFRQVVAATAVSSLAMGTGLKARAEVTHPEHLHALLQRVVATPVSKVNRAYDVRNDHTFWDK